MSAQALKMKRNLEKIKKERLLFENKKSLLDAEMSKGRINMTKIKKGLRNNEIVDSPMDVSMNSTENVSLNSTMSLPKATAPQKKSKHLSIAHVEQNNRNPSGSLSPRPSSGQHNQLVIVPTGPRVSDWCFVGTIESDPPVVKSNTVYETVRLLGRGAFGDVNLVKCIEDNRLFAIKTIFTEKESEMKDTLREVRFLRMNRHPCIIDVHDGFMTAQPRILFIVMPYCEGGDLDALIKNTKKSKQFLPEDKILRWSIQIGLAMHFLHENGVVHRDLKPNNIMLTEGGDLIKVVDFGLAMSMKEESTKAPLEAGTPYYTAPEMIQNLQYSYPVDCWSFGVLLHEMLALELPFTGESTGDLVRSILEDQPPPVPAHYSLGIKLVASELLHKDMSLRMGMAGMLMHPLLHQKTLLFPPQYRPKSLEERIRRGHARQLTSQIESLSSSKNSAMTSASNQWSSVPLSVDIPMNSENQNGESGMTSSSCSTNSKTLPNSIKMSNSNNNVDDGNNDNNQCLELISDGVRIEGDGVQNSDMLSSLEIHGDDKGRNGERQGQGESEKRGQGEREGGGGGQGQESGIDMDKKGGISPTRLSSNSVDSLEAFLASERKAEGLDVHQIEPTPLSPTLSSSSVSPSLSPQCDAVQRRDSFGVNDGTSVGGQEKPIPEQGADPGSNSKSRKGAEINAAIIKAEELSQYMDLGSTPDTIDRL